MAEETIIQTSSVNAPYYNYTFDATNITGHAYDGIHSYVCQTNTSRLGKYEVKGKEVDFRPFPELKEYLNSCKKYLCPVWCWTPDPYHASDSDSACTGFVHQMCEYTTDGDPRIDCNAWFDDSVEKEKHNRNCSGLSHSLQQFGSHITLSYDGARQVVASSKRKLTRTCTMRSAIQQWRPGHRT